MWLGLAGVGAGVGGEVAEGVKGGAGEGKLDKLVEDSAGWGSKAGGAGPQVTVKKKAGGHRASDRCWRTSMA